MRPPVLAGVVVLVLGGCSGVSADQHRSVVEELDESRRQLSTAEEEITSLRTQLEGLQPAVELRGRLEQVTARLEEMTALEAESRTELAARNEKIGRAAGYLRMLQAFFDLGLAGEEPDLSRLADLVQLIDQIEDPELQDVVARLFEAGTEAEAQRLGVELVVAAVDGALRALE